MHTTRFAVWILIAGTWCGAIGQGAPNLHAADARAPVLIELFTSEGCSDCPPAEKLLGQVAAMQPFPGVNAIVLEEHVTYWDHQGWRDPFSLEEMTDRQKEYQQRFGLSDIYTPQMVVDGAEQFVGSDAGALEKAIAAESDKSRTALTIDGAHLEKGAATFSVHAAPTKGTRLVVMVAADAAVSQVAHGENAGKTLHHVAVVRGLKEFGGDAVDGRPLKVPNKNSADPERIVAFLVDQKTGHVLGAAEATLNAP